MAGDWLTIALRLALYLDLAAAFGVALFALYALGRDERSSAVARRFRTLVGAAAALGIGLSVWALTVLAKAMSGAQSYAELTTHVFEMLITGTHMGISRADTGLLVLSTDLFHPDNDIRPNFSTDPADYVPGFNGGYRETIKAVYLQWLARWYPRWRTVISLRHDDTGIVG